MASTFDTIKNNRAIAWAQTFNLACHKLDLSGVECVRLANAAADRAETACKERVARECSANETKQEGQS